MAIRDHHRARPLRAARRATALVAAGVLALGTACAADDDGPVGPEVPDPDPAEHEDPTEPPVDDPAQPEFDDDLDADTPATPDAELGD